MKLSLFAPLVLALGLFGCADGFDDDMALDMAIDDGGEFVDDGNGNGSSAGLITAGEWNDLDNWGFWLNLMNNADLLAHLDSWGYSFAQRVSVEVTAGGAPAVDVPVELRSGDQVVFAARTDIFGSAELWPYLQPNVDVDFGTLELWVDGQRHDQAVQLYEQGAMAVDLAKADPAVDLSQICFIVDATGSMGDELEFLKDDLEDVLVKAREHNPATTFSTGSVFYRDHGDEYVVRTSEFSNNLMTTVQFIRGQSAAGGGDYPEAVHSALSTAVNTFDWAPSATSRIAFLLLDAPPHDQVQVIQSIQADIRAAAAKGIKVIPIAASGVNKSTEFLLRSLSIVTNGTYVFITDDSGIGNDHLEPTVGEYQVEYLNQLMLRLIDKYLGTSEEVMRQNPLVVLDDQR